MNVLIVGCGKVGSRLAGTLSREGHDVSVVDREEDNFALLPEDYAGFKTCGIPIDQEVLRRAGIENCDALAAVSNDDNVNIMVSELAREVFHVPNVVTRIYDPAREDVFSHFGLHTICPTNLTVESMRADLLGGDRPQTVRLQSHTLSFFSRSIPAGLVGRQASEYPLEEGQSLYGVVHADLSLTPYQGQALRLSEGDEVILSTMVD